MIKKIELERATYSPDEAFRVVGCGRNAGYEAIRRGEIPSIRIGRLIRVPKVALHRLLEGPGPKAA